MQDVQIYSKNFCPYCHRAMELLKIKGIPYTVIDVTDDARQEEERRHRSGRVTVPQIFIGEIHIGGSDDLFALDEQGGLDPLLSQLSA